MTTCPYCKDTVQDFESIECPACEAAHHLECWRANGEFCCVYGCESHSEEDLSGCPWCEEVYQKDRRFCMVCSSPLMSRKQYGEFLDRYEWVPLSLSSDQNAVLTAGFLRNNGIVARLQKGIPVSMFFPVAAKVFVAREDAVSAQEMLSDLKKNIRTCPGCGHLLMLEEEECSYCAEERSVRL